MRTQMELELPNLGEYALRKHEGIRLLRLPTAFFFHAALGETQARSDPGTRPGSQAAQTGLKTL